MTFFGILFIVLAIGALVGKIMAARSNTFREAGINPTTLPYGYITSFLQFLRSQELPCTI